MKGASRLRAPSGRYGQHCNAGILAHWLQMHHLQAAAAAAAAHLLIVFQRWRIAAEVPVCNASHFIVELVSADTALAQHRAHAGMHVVQQAAVLPWRLLLLLLPGAGFVGVLVILIVLLLTKLHRGCAFSRCIHD